MARSQARSSICTSGLIAALMFLTMSAMSQEKIEISTDPPAAAARYPVLRTVGGAKVLWNERQNQVIAETGFLHIAGIRGELEGARLKARFVSVGKTVLKPDAIKLMIFSTDATRRYVDDRRIKIIVDGKVLIDSTTKFVSATTDGRVIIASLEHVIPYADFAKIAESKLVTMQVGPSMVFLQEEDIQSFRDLLKTIE